MKKGSLIFKIATTMVTAVLIPLAVALGLVLYTEWSIKELTHQSSNRILNQFLVTVDNTMVEASDTVLSIGNNKQCKNYSRYAIYQADKTIYQTLAVQDELIERNNVKYYDVFVYYPQDDRVISSVNGSAAADDYFIANYMPNGYEREMFDDILDMKLPRPHVLKLPGQREYLCVGMRQSFSGNENLDFMIVLVLRTEYIDGLMRDGQSDDEGSLLIFGSDKSLIAGNDNGNDYSIDWYDGQTLQKDMTSPNGGYTIYAQDFSSVDGYCAYALSTDMFEDALDQLKVILIIGMAICLVAGVFAVLFGTKKVYAPIKSVVKDIKGKKLVKPDAAPNEIELIKEAININAEDKRRLNYLDKESETARRRKLISAAMQDGDGIEKTVKSLSALGTEFASGCFAVCIIQIKDSGSIAGFQQEFVIENVFAEIAQNQGEGYFAESRNGQHPLLINFRDPETAAVDSEVWITACSFLREHYDADISVYFSQVHYGTEEICTAYQEAVAAQKYRYLMTDENYIDYACVKDRKFTYISSVESKLSRTIIGYLKERNHSIPEEEFVDQLFETYEINLQSSIDTVECFKYELISVLHKAFAVCGASEQADEILGDMTGSQSLVEFREKLITALELCMSKRQVFSKTEDVCKRVEDYILQQYSDPQLSMEIIGRKVHMSPYYISKLFKAERGISVLGYIAKVRIDQAKKLLKETDKSIVKISEETGFMSSTVFIRTFRKLEGVTPGVYRSIKE